MGACLGVFAALAVAVVWHSRWLVEMDNAALHWVVQLRTPERTELAKSASILGTAVVYLVVLGAWLVGYKRLGWHYLAIALISLAGAQLVRLAINLLIHRPRPSHVYWLVNANWYSFPSGHTVAAGVGFGLAAWLIWITNQHAGVAAAIIAVVVSVLVGFSRIYLGVHWTSDVVGSLVLASGWLALTFIVAARITGG
jgi:undecaprenyl-diphosphatase